MVILHRKSHIPLGQKGCDIWVKVIILGVTITGTSEDSIYINFATVRNFVELRLQTSLFLRVHLTVISFKLEFNLISYITLSFESCNGRCRNG